MIRKVLIANRGEIAVRIIRAARELDIATVAVYSEADRDALHVRLADEAALLGPAPANESYLVIDKLIEAAKLHGADAIHPGYGFLSERAPFARAVIEAGLTWIGPPPEAIELLGDKVESRRAMQQAGVPVTPGYDGETSDLAVLEKEADRIGLPLLVKAAAGGGGKGMRIVRERSGIREAIDGAMREAKAAFGDDRVFLERYVEKPRHIEFQVFADSHGHAVHLFERECSIQRRHQKVVEECPSTALTDKLRTEMGAAAVKAIKTAGYVNAGTVEFLLDHDGEHFYFLEVNTRIQVEHPITEEVVGVDLVAEQFRIASGEKLPWKQEELAQKGHAIQARIYAEDVAAGFLPSAGPLLHLEEPTGPGIRVDSGVMAGGEVAVHYDPIMAKVIAWGGDREAARLRLIRALEHYVVLGVPTTAPFLRDVLAHDAFRSGATYTDFIETHFEGWDGRDEALQPLALAAAATLPGADAATQASAAATRGEPASPWELAGPWRIGSTGGGR